MEGEGVYSAGWDQLGLLDLSVAIEVQGGSGGDILMCDAARVDALGRVRDAGTMHRPL